MSNSPLRAALAAGFVLTAVGGCSEEVIESAEVPIRPAKLFSVSAVSDIRTLTFPAVIEARESSELAFQVGGKLQALKVVEGRPIERGAEIARLDQATLRNDVASARSQFKNADDEYQRARRLIRENAIARNVFEQRKSQRDVARAALDSASKTLADSVLRAPFSGVIAKIHIEQFQNVQPNEAIVTLQTTGAAEAAVQIPSRLVANSGRIEPQETMVVLDAAPDLRLPAVFKSASTQADAETQSFAVKFAFTPPTELRVLPGMTGRVESTLLIKHAGGSSEQLRIPLAAIQSDGDAHYVWVVSEETMTVSKRPITLAADIGETLEVLDGLSAGETIVAAGASYLHEGMQIRRYDQ